jgi:hypothetical protein
MFFNRKAAAIAAFIALSLPIATIAQISPGTQLTGNIDQGFDSKSAQVNQTFTLSNVHSSNHDINGAKIYGHIAKVRAAGQGTKAEIELAIDKVNTQSGGIYKVQGYVTNVQVNTKSNAGKEAGAAAGGALVGGLIGNTTGAIIGGAGGFLYAKNSKQNVSIPQGSLVTVSISSSTKVK